MTLHAAPASWLDSVALCDSLVNHLTSHKEDKAEGHKRTLALALLQLVQAFGVIESGTFLLLLAEVPALR